MPLTAPPALSRDWTAQKLWNAAALDFPENALKTLRSDEWKIILNKSIAETKQKFSPIIGQQYMTRALLTQVDGEVDFSSLRVDASDFRRIKLSVTLANVLTLGDLLDLNSQSFSQTVSVGTNTLGIPQNLLGDWIFDKLLIGGDPTGWEVISITPTEIEINALVAGEAEVSLGRLGALLSGATIVNVGSMIQPMRFRMRAVLSTGSNIVSLVIGGDVVTMVGDYSINGFMTDEAGIEFTSLTPSSVVVNSAGPTTLEMEIVGNAIFGGTVVNLYEQRMRESLSSGVNSITFPVNFGSTNYAVLTVLTYNDSGGIIGNTISNRTSAGLDIEVLEDCTLMLRVAELGAAYESVPIAPASVARMFRVDTKEEFESFRPDAKRNQNSGIYWFGGEDKLFVAKGYGLAQWQSFILHYPRIPYLITATTDKPDLPDGIYMEHAILTAKEKIAERCGLKQLVADVPQRKAVREKEEFARAGVSVGMETVQNQNVRLNQ